MPDHVMTVRGPVDPADIGPTMVHEHVFLDSRKAWWSPETCDDQELAEAPLIPRHGGLARWYANGIRDNLFIGADDYQSQIDELSDFVSAGGSCLVELTNGGLSPLPELVQRLANDLDLHIVAGCGFYLHTSHPVWVEEASTEEIEAFVEREIHEGLAGTQVKPGIIGEIGTSDVIYPCEIRVLKATARAAATTGTSLNVHLTSTSDRGLDIVAIVLGEGLDPERLVLSHLDEYLDTDYHLSLLKQGVSISFDTLGFEGYMTRQWKSPSDIEKINALAELLNQGYERQLLMSQDVGFKCQLKRFGGMGYDHVLSRIVPALRDELGVDQRTIDTMLIANPRRILSRSGNAP